MILPSPCKSPITSARHSSRQAFSIHVAPSALPNLTIGGLPATMDASQQSALILTLDSRLYPPTSRSNHAGVSARRHRQCGRSGSPVRRRRPHGQLYDCGQLAAAHCANRPANRHRLGHDHRHDLVPACRLDRRARHGDPNRSHRQSRGQYTQRFRRDRQRRLRDTHHRLVDAAQSHQCHCASHAGHRATICRRPISRSRSRASPSSGTRAPPRPNSAASSRWCCRSR